MDQQQTRKRQAADALTRRNMAQQRKAKRTDEIAGQQAQLKLEAQQRRERKSKSS